jgi:endonuclease G
MKSGEVFVVTGGVLEKGLKEIGEEDVDVPRFYFKIIAKGTKSNLKIIAFLIPATESQKPLNLFMVTVDSIEKLTGLDFFRALPDDVESTLESKVDASEWKF